MLDKAILGDVNATRNILTVRTTGLAFGKINSS